MTEKQIEKAVKKYAKKQIPDLDGFKRNHIEQAFEEGASWRIKSVWHNNTVNPTEYSEEKFRIRGCYCVFFTKNCLTIMQIGKVFCDEKGKFYIVTDSGHPYIWADIKLWAYADDIMPITLD